MKLFSRGPTGNLDLGKMASLTSVKFLFDLYENPLSVSLSFLEFIGMFAVQHKGWAFAAILVGTLKEFYELAKYFS